MKQVYSITTSSSWMFPDKGSEEEESLVNTYIELTNEKNSLVAKQDYYNIIEKIRIVLAEINSLNKRLGEITKSTSDNDSTFYLLFKNRIKNSFLQISGREGRNGQSYEWIHGCHREERPLHPRTVRNRTSTVSFFMPIRCYDYFNVGSRARFLHLKIRCASILI